MRLGNLLETLRSLKREEEGMIVCPRCASSSIQRTSALDGWLLPEHFTCKECGYSGYLALEIRKDSDSTA